MMLPFFTSIACRFGYLDNKEAHLQRIKEVNRHFKWIDFWTRFRRMDLEAQEKFKQMPLAKLKIYFGEKDFAIDFEAYQPVQIRNVVLAEISESFTYNKKVSDRAFFDYLRSQNPYADEVIMVQNGLLTDSTYCNLAFYSADKNRWETPTRPLLAGTQRARLLNNATLHLADIRPGDLLKYQQIAFINAMRPLGVAQAVNDIKWSGAGLILGG